jgi:protocatechuate 3,4-dioxygenase beta subunit
MRFSTRRRFLKHLTTGAAATGSLAFFEVPGLFAEELTLTPKQTEGPFYPDHLPLDTDNDLIIINNSITPAVGTITHLSGRILDRGGSPIRNALVEIWQVDNNGVYINTKSQPHDKLDKNFQGYGRFLTGSTGDYYFRTIRPVRYLRRAPHIHFAVKIRGQAKWTTQCYIRGESLNARDHVLQTVNPKRRDAVMVDFTPIPGSSVGELAAHFDIVLGLTARST